MDTVWDLIRQAAELPMDLPRALSLMDRGVPFLTGELREILGQLERTFDTQVIRSDPGVARVGDHSPETLEDLLEAIAKNDTQEGFKTLNDILAAMDMAKATLSNVSAIAGKGVWERKSVIAKLKKALATNNERRKQLFIEGAASSSRDLRVRVVETKVGQDLDELCNEIDSICESVNILNRKATKENVTELMSLTACVASDIETAPALAGKAREYVAHLCVVIRKVSEYLTDF